MEFLDCKGLEIHYKWIDNKKEHTFLFINSLGTDFRIWDELLKKLGVHGNILLHDKRGHGLSGVSGTTKELPDFLDDIVFILEHLSIKKIIPVGLSVGGMIAQLLAYHHPEIIYKLILCDTRHKIGNAQIWNDRIAAVKGEGLQGISQGVMQRWFSEKFRVEQPTKVAGYQNMLERTPVLGYIQTCEAIRDADLTAVVKQIKIPTLCVVGSEDKSTTPVEVKDLADLIAGSKYEVIECSGHLPCVDNPGALSDLIIQFILQ